MSFSRPIVLLLLLVLAATLLLQRCGAGKDAAISRSRILMGTVVEITALGGSEEDADRAVTDAFEEMARIEHLMSSRIATSEVSTLSLSKEGLEVSDETAEVIAIGLRVQKRSGGAFDMTLGRLKALWGLDSENPRVPTEMEIAEALAGTGPGALLLKDRKVTKARPDLAVDLGGIAKGYAIDRAVEVLKAAGIGSASVNAGGDIRLIGNRQGRPWRLGIQHPRDKGKLLATLSLEEASVVTSGDYERFFEAGGIRYHHLFDPRTGRPARSCRSVTVVAQEAALADALATAAFVLGPEEGLKLLEGVQDVEGLIVDAEGKARATVGLEGRIDWP